MNVAVAIALIALAVQFGTAATMFYIARAPGWKRTRVFGVAALSAGLYSTVDVWAVLGDSTFSALGWVVRLNLTLAAIHASAWVVYTFADDSGRLSSLSRGARWLTVGTVLIVSAIALPGFAVDTSITHRLALPSLGVTYTSPQLTPIGNVGAVLVLLTLLVVLVEQVRRARRGVPGSVGLAIGFTLFGLCTIEEVLVAAGVFNFLYLADVGYLCIAIPVTTKLLRRFTDDARRLAALSARLADEVEARTAERDAARDALLEQERLAALGRLAAGVGHEVNNPLQYLTASLEEVRSVAHAARVFALETPLANAFEGAERIRQVVQGLRTYATPSGESLHAVDVHEIVRAAVRIATPQVRHLADLRLDLRMSPPVMGDEGKLVQALLNPIVNAAQALQRQSPPRRGTITITTLTTENGDASICVSDDGPGFDAAVLPHIGEPYVTTRADQGGTGLGLFVSRGLVAAMGGELTLRNADGSGAMITVRLPAAPLSLQPTTNLQRPATNESTALAASTNAAAPPVGDGTRLRAAIRVLLVDDEASIRHALSRGLVRLGFHVTAAEDGSRALALADTLPFDVVVSDLMMPNLSGMELADHLADRHPALRRHFVVMSGGAITPQAEQFLQREDILSLEKPVEMSHLATTIRHSLAGASDAVD